MRDMFLAPSVIVPGRTIGNLLSGTSLLLCLWVLGGLFAMEAPSARANILPEAVLYIHVQDTPDPSFCQTNPITSCQQIDRTSYATGSLEFDVFVHPFAAAGEHLPLRSVDANVTWPSAWHRTSFEPCSGGEGSVVSQTGGGRMHVEFSDTLLIPDAPLLIARFVMNVSGQGSFNTEDVEINVGFGADFTTLMAWGIDAQAGVICNACGAVCGHSFYCQPFFPEAPLELVEGPDGTATGLFEVFMDEVFAGACSESWTTDQPWLEVTSATAWHPAPWNWHVEVRARSSGLSGGVHEAHVTGSVPGCSGCGFVRFTVPVTSGVDLPEPQENTTTWGRIKNRYR